MRRLGQIYDAELAAAGLKATQYSLLSHIDKLGPIRPTELAQANKLDASTLSRNLKPLVQAGWALVQPGDDGRSLLVSITQAGKAKRAEAQRRWRAAQEHTNQLLGMENVLALHDLLDDCLVKLSSAATEGEAA